jgi:hypothetical protein
MFTPDTIRERHQRRPFVPMRIVTNSGGHYEIYHPEMMMIGKQLVVVGTPSAHNPLVYETTSQLSILEITTIEDLPPKALGSDYP